MLCFGILVAYCMSRDVPSNAATFCKTATPLYFSKSDTLQTREEIDTHNKIGKALCGWKGNPKQNGK